MAILFERKNDALNINPPAGQQQLSVNGSDWLWAVTAIFVISFVRYTLLIFFPFLLFLCFFFSFPNSV